MLLLAFYFFLDFIVDRYFLNSSFYFRVLISFAVQLVISFVSIMISLFLIVIFLEFVQIYGVFNNYLEYLISITKGDISSVQGNVIVQLAFAVCIISYFLYFSVFFIGKKHLIKVGILNEVKLRKINKPFVQGKLNSLYTILIFWTGFVPLFASVFGGDKIEVEIIGFATCTFASAIPYTHIQLTKFFSV